MVVDGDYYFGGLLVRCAWVGGQSDNMTDVRTRVFPVDRPLPGWNSPAKSPIVGEKTTEGNGIRRVEGGRDSNPIREESLNLTMVDGGELEVRRDGPER